MPAGCNTGFFKVETAITSGQKLATVDCAICSTSWLERQVLDQGTYDDLTARTDAFKRMAVQLQDFFSG